MKHTLRPKNSVLRGLHVPKSSSASSKELNDTSHYKELQFLSFKVSESTAIQYFSGSFSFDFKLARCE